jgi:hypothetical protein
MGRSTGGAGRSQSRVAVPYADAMLVPLPAGVDPVAVASVADTFSDAYRPIGPWVEQIRRHPKDPASFFSAPCGVAASSAPVCRCMPRRSPARWSRRLMCSSLRLGLRYVSTRPGWVSTPANRKPSDGVRHPWSSTPAQTHATLRPPFGLPRPTGSTAAPVPCTLQSRSQRPACSAATAPSQWRAATSGQ